MKRFFGNRKRTLIVLCSILVALALAVGGSTLYRFYEDKRKNADIIAPFLMLNGNLYQESPEKNGLVGRISEEEQAQFRFEKIGTIQKEVAHNRLPVEDFMSNFGSVGADVYLSSDGQHAYLKVEKGYLRFDLWKDNTRAVYELTYPGMV